MTDTYISSHRSGGVIWIDMIWVPTEHRGRGIGRKLYRDWERDLPDDITTVMLMAADTGDGVSNGFWEAMGFAYRYDGEDLSYEAQQQMWRGVNGHPTPETVRVEEEDEFSENEGPPDRTW